MKSPSEKSGQNLGQRIGQKLGQSLGLTLGSKVVLIFVAALFLLGVLAWGFSKPWRGPWRDQLPKVMWVNLRAHMIETVERIGTPPTIEKARAVLSDLKLELLVREKGQVAFSTTENYPPLPKIDAEIADEIEARNLRPGSLRSKLGDFMIGRTDARMFAVVERDGRQYVFFLPEREGFQAGLRAFSGFAFTIAFLLLVVLGVTNWLLRPMKPLMIGVGELSKGNLDYRVSIQPRGEFGRVAAAFNDMAETLQRQLKSKDQLLMDVSHELRSPLGRLKMAAEMLPHEDGATSLRSQIQADTREMEELVTELLELYRQTTTSSARVDVDLVALIRDAVSPLIEATPGVQYRLPHHEIRIAADVRRLKRALRNVVENGMKFSRHQSRPVEVTVETRDGYHIIEVRDHGVGMTEEQQVRIFEPFYRADTARVRETGGFGLGMTLTQAILKAHSATITCTSQLDVGSSFKIAIPANS
jgi:two-component system, OmpR family, sensor histidine kinase CpxA